MSVNGKKLGGLLLAAMFPAWTPAMDGPPAVDLPTVYPVVETVPVESGDDAADDPAIWVNPADPAASLVLGTDKQSGLGVYDLDGNLLQFLGTGRLNNVDLRSGEVPGYGPAIVVAASNRDVNGIDLFEIDPLTGRVHQPRAESIPTGLTEIYGLCMAAHADGLWVFVNDKDGRYQQWNLVADIHSLDAERVREFRVETQPEGCVADEARGVLYVGEENRGIWKFALDPTVESAPQLVADVGTGELTADVEGLAIWDDGDSAWLVASSQGDFTYAVYDLLDGDRYVGSFRVGDRADGAIDGSEETDGLEVVSAALGDTYPRGLLVVQDGFNRLPDANQNFKYISWADVEAALGLTGN